MMQWQGAALHTQIHTNANIPLMLHLSKLINDAMKD